MIVVTTSLAVVATTSLRSEPPASAERSDTSDVHVEWPSRAAGALAALWGAHPVVASVATASGCLECASVEDQISTHTFLEEIGM